MTLLDTLAARIRGLFRRTPAEDAWLLPENHVTRAIDSGRSLAKYTERPSQAASAPESRPRLDVEGYLADLPPLPEPARRIVISDDDVHAVEKPLAPSEKPLEATPAKKKRWWRAA